MTAILNQLAERWFDWEVSMLWQVGLLIIIIAGIDLLIKKWTWPQVRYALWLLILVKLVLPPSLTSPTSFTAEIPFMVKQTAIKINQPQISPQTTQALEPAVEMMKTKTEEPLAQVRGLNRSELPQRVDMQASLSWKVYIMFVWTGGMAILAGWLVIRLGNLRREHLKNKQQSNLPERLEGLLESTAKKLRLRKVPQVILTNKVCCPAVFGVFRPVLLMPAGKLQNMTVQDAEHIFLHELAHIKRGDLFVHAVYMILQIVYWFNPLIWLARKPMQNLRELCCDATVAKLLKEKTAGYRQTLLETARQLLAEPVDPGLGLLGLFENSSWLVDRLKWLEKKSWRYRPLRIATIFILICVMSACVLPMAKFKAVPDFIIKGTVTDAKTGKPIAGAIVGDVVTYAYGKYNTTTDANGNYSYKTYYEEHILKCRAAGYKDKTDILLVKLLGEKEKEKVVNFELKATEKNILATEDTELTHSTGSGQAENIRNIKQNDFSIKLSNGTKVELIGICEHPSKGKQWWRPDAALLEESHYDDDFGKAFPRSGEKGYKFAVKFSGLAGKKVDARIIPTNFKTINGGTLLSISEKDGKENIKYIDGSPNEKVVWLGAAFDEQIKQCDLRVGVCWGQWQNDYAYEKDRSDDAVEWIDFKNVSLKPGVKTDVQIERVDKEGIRAQEHKTVDGTVEKEKLQSNQNDLSIFESYFPEDVEAGKKLDEWWENKGTINLDDDSFFELFRKGLRKCTIKYKDNFPMQYIGVKYIWNREPDDQRAIDLVYYASFSPEYKYYAVYSGLSVANPKSEKVLKRLVDIALEYHQLGRIIWGVKQSKQGNEFIAFLEPYLRSSDPVKREHADIVVKAFKGEIDWDRWEREWNQKQQTEKTIREFGNNLPEIKKTFLTGTSEERRKACKFVNRNGITLFHDSSFMAALGECAKDNDADIRAETARILGSNFVWGQNVQPAEAIEILLQLSKDQSQNVRYQAVYFGLSVITNKDEQVIKQLVEMALNESNSNDFVSRIRWGLTFGADKEIIKKHLMPYFDIKSDKHDLAKQLYKEIFKEEPSDEKEKLQNLVEDFFKHNYRDITQRKTIEWGEPIIDANGNQSIRYKYQATIWDKDKIITNQLFVFDKDEKLISFGKIEADVRLYSIDFEITKQSFLEGDSIEITEVLGSTDKIETGQTYTVKGKYDLSSADEAMLHIYATNGEIDSQQGPVIKRGSGDFTRTFTYQKEGWLHLSFYPANGGSGFGGIYFAQKGSAEKVPDISTITSNVSKSVSSGSKDLDVYIEEFSIQPYPAGGLYTVTAKIGNHGTATAPAFRMNFYKGDPKENQNLFGKPQTGSHGAGPIKPGEFWNEQSSPFAIEGGINQFTVVLDTDSSIAEANELNNSAAIKVLFENGEIIKNPR
ncbi:MAG: M56 family metallopeptidase [Phycisphaerae bacterium]|jgi:beta-lactamase regulating signal transducer with metallopeptidase domain